MQTEIMVLSSFVFDKQMAGISFLFKTFEILLEIVIEIHDISISFRYFTNINQIMITTS